MNAAASSAELMQAIRIVNQGSVWAPRRVLSLFIERVRSAPDPLSYAGRLIFTNREKEVLLMLVAGRSNKEIGDALGIGEHSVKAHVSKLLRKNRVPNRIALSVLAVSRSLVFSLQKLTGESVPSDCLCQCTAIDLIRSSQNSSRDRSIKS